jgi:hypothetical protein
MNRMFGRGKPKEPPPNLRNVRIEINSPSKKFTTAS